MKRSQKKINTEVDAVRVLMTISVWNVGLRWNQRMFCELFGWSQMHCNEVIEWLAARDLVELRGAQCFISSQGREHLAGALIKPQIQISIRAWKDEVLSGMDSRGRQTKIDRAALPSPGREQSTSESADEIIGREQTWDRMARALGLSRGAFDDGVSEGRIRACKGGHVGIFDRNGKGWRSLCRKCRRAGR